MQGRLQGKKALVTAAAQGIGRAIADLYAAEGAWVVATDIRLPLDTATAPDMAQLGAIQWAQLDVTDAGGVESLFAELGRVDILVNAAGYVHHGTILDCDAGAWARSIDLNLTSMYRTIRAVLPGMIEAGGGSIINIASVASSIKGVPDRFAYGATKAGVIGLTKGVAADFVAQGVRCNAICPGTIETPSLRERAARQARDRGIGIDQALAAFAARQPIGRLGRAEEIAALALYLAEDASAFTTGTTHVIDGGWIN